MNKLPFLTVLILTILFLVSWLANISLGSVYIPFTEVFKVVLGIGDSSDTNQIIVSEFRLPKSYAAILCGISLSISGMLMQNLFRNPLAGPYVLGISNGAGLLVCFAILVGVPSLPFVGELSVSFFALLGAYLFMTFIGLFIKRIQEISSILVIGVMLGSLTASIISLLQYFSQAEKIKEYLIWSFGSFSGLSNTEILIFLLITLISLVWVFLLNKNLNALLLGNQYAETLGVNVNKTRNQIIIITSLLAGVSTAFCGPIAFVGIAVPFISRQLIKTIDNKSQLLVNVLLGASFLLWVDLISQLPFSDLVLPINVVTSLIGAPVVIFIVLKFNKRNKS